MLVKNLNGTADNKAPYGYISWLDFWEKKSGKKAHECAHCRAKATVGAHVQKASIEDRRWFIVPLCEKCNQKPSTDVFAVYEELAPVRD